MRGSSSCSRLKFRQALQSVSPVISVRILRASSRAAYQLLDLDKMYDDHYAFCFITVWTAELETPENQNKVHKALSILEE